jgi:hypothetical protein
MQPFRSKNQASLEDAWRQSAMSRSRHRTGGRSNATISGANKEKES